MGFFPARRAIERLRAGLFDAVAVDRLTMEESSIIQNFSKGLKALEKGQSGHLCLCGSYGQGKSHNLAYLQRQAISQGYATSLLQLDVREVPFHQFLVVYQSLMNNLSLPNEKSFACEWKKCSFDVLDDMPHRFRMILQAMKSKNSIPLKRKSVKNRLKIKDFDDWLEQALMGHDLPTTYLKQILNARKVEEYQSQPLTLCGNAPYVLMIQSLGKLLHGMGYKGLVLFFDEAESIAQGRLGARVKSYEILNQFFQHRGFVYPIFAFTETFFDQVRCEENGFDLWKNLEILRLQDSSKIHWEVLQDRLIALYAEAYQLDLSSKLSDIQQQMSGLLEKLQTQETRFKLKALIHQLDILCTRTAS